MGHEFIPGETEFQKSLGVPVVAQAVNEPDQDHEDSGLIHCTATGSPTSYLLKYPMTERFGPGDIHLNSWNLQENIKDYLHRKIV